MQQPSWFRKIIKPMPPEKRKEIVSEITPSASPGFDFFLLVVLSCSIATLGLITDSPAVIIGAMLVAPLMSPIIGIGLASLTGNTKLLQNAVSALLRGALLAIALATLMTFINNHLPFFSMQELPKEVLARTRPTPIDLVIALAGGIAAAYAMTQPNLSAALPGVAIATALMPPLCTIGIGIALNRWDVAGGATLLFITNTVTIAFASVTVFFLRGFSSNIDFKNREIPKGLIYAAILTGFLLIPLSYLSIQFFKDASENRLIHSVVANEVRNINRSELVDMNLIRKDKELEMLITIRTGTALDYKQVVELQKSIVYGIKLPVSLKVSQVIAEYLDPLNPPTPTYTPTLYMTSTFGPSPTSTMTSTPTKTATPTNTATSTRTPMPSSTPAVGEIIRYSLPDMKIYQQPGGPSIGNLLPRQKVTVLYGKEMFDGLVWIEIRDDENRIGWIPEIYAHLLIPTMTPTNLPSLTLPAEVSKVQSAQIITFTPSQMTASITPNP